jgi:hypothetical protein
VISVPSPTFPPSLLGAFAVGLPVRPDHAKSSAIATSPDCEDENRRKLRPIQDLTGDDAGDKAGSSRHGAARVFSFRFSVFSRKDGACVLSRSGNQGLIRARQVDDCGVVHDGLLTTDN